MQTLRQCLRRKVLFVLLLLRTILRRQWLAALLVVMLGLKLLELRARRDIHVTVFLGYFLVLTQFLYDQSLWLAGYLFLGLLALMSPARGGSEAMMRTRELGEAAGGYLWVGTQEGIARFDGVRFTVTHSARRSGSPPGSVLVVTASSAPLAAGAWPRWSSKEAPPTAVPSE